MKVVDRDFKMWYSDVNEKNTLEENIMKYGLQLFSMHTLSTELGLKETLKKTAELGYDCVEFAGFFELTPEQAYEELQKYGLECAGIHYGLQEIRDKGIEEAVRVAKVVKAYSVCIPYYNCDTAQGWIDMAKEINEYGKAFKEAGILFGYHNHIHEFTPVEDKVPMDLILENSDAENVFFEMDTRHMTLAGVDTVEYAKKFTGRTPVMHARDTNREHDCATGSGVVDFKATVSALGGVEIYIVENENFGKNDQELLDSCKYLKETF